MSENDDSVGQVKTRELEVLIHPERTVEQWVRAGKYHFRNPNLTTGNFGQYLTTRKDAKEPYRAKVVAFNIGCSADIEKARRIRHSLKLKEIGFEHLAAVGEQYPEVLRELVLTVNPDAVWLDPVDGLTVPYIYVIRVYAQPITWLFHLQDAKLVWGSIAWFLGLREE